MLDVTLLYCNAPTPSAAHRYGCQMPGPYAVPLSAAARRPIVVWNITRRCNLACEHCYSDSDASPAPAELSTVEAKAVLEDLASFGVPAVLFSGGEPLMRPDVLDLIDTAGKLGLRTVLSTNGTLIDLATARRLAQSSLSYVGVSLDAADAETHDRFRCRPGAYDKSLAAISLLKNEGQKVGLRLTLTAHNADLLNAVFELIEEYRIDRVCFYHLIPVGRGGQFRPEGACLLLDPARTRSAMDTILARTREALADGRPLEVLTVDNHCDGPYLYLKLLAENALRAERVRQLLAWNGGGRFAAGVGIGCIDWEGNVHPNQFWRHYRLGNVREKPFSELWTNKPRKGFLADPLLRALRNRLPYLKGRCARCRFKSLCGGSSRVRAELTTGDPWAPDPACYLTDEEITQEEPYEKAPSLDLIEK